MLMFCLRFLLTVVTLTCLLLSFAIFCCLRSFSDAIALFCSSRPPNTVIMALLPSLYPHFLDSIILTFAYVLLFCFVLILLLLCMLVGARARDMFVVC